MVHAVEEDEQAEDAAAIGERWLRSRLSPEEMGRLSTQGFVARHRLPSGARCAKLRFRDATGRQIVRYMGVDPKLADGVASALAHRQRTCKRRHAAAHLVRCDRRKLREVKRRLAPSLERHGVYYHGLVLRQRGEAAPTRAIQFRITKIGAPPSMIVPINQELSPQSTSVAVPSSHIYDDLRRWSQESEEPDDVVLRFMAAELLDLSAMLLTPVKQEISRSEAPLDAMEDLYPSREMLLKLTRQADRLLSLSYRRDDGNRQKAKKASSDTYAGVEYDSSEEAAGVSPSNAAESRA